MTDKTSFTIELAGIPIAVLALFSSTKEFCKDYLTDKDGEFIVELSEEDIIDERARNDRQMRLEGLGQQDFSDNYIETLALYRKIADRFFEKDILLFHGCVIACDDKAYIFTAKSGTGKTTHARLWLENIKGSYILNGDKPLLLFKDGTAYACGTPWMGKECMGVNEILPVEGICFVERDTTNHIEKAPFAKIYSRLIEQTHKPDSVSIIGIINKIKNFERISIYRLGCNMDKEAAMVAYQGMSKKQ